MMASEQMLAWVVQNAYALFIGAVVAAIAEIVFKVFIWDDYISPSFRFRLNFYKNKIKKWIQNSTTELSYSSRSVDIESLGIKIEKITDIVNQLRLNKLPARGLLDITIENYKTGKMSLSGSIKFSTVTRKSEGEILKDFTITLTTQLRYQSMNDEIPALIQYMSKMKEYLSIALNVPLKYDDSISCRLTKFVVELSEAMKDLKLEYVKFGGEQIELSIAKDRVVFHSPSDASIVLPQLRKFVVLYS